MHDMNHYIHRQADAMKASLLARKETCQTFCRIWKEVRPDRVYLVGSGTSGTAIRAAAGFVEQALQTETTALSPTSLPALVTGRPLFVYVSQGGASTNTLRAIEQMKAYPGIALTGEEDCAINKACGGYVKLCCEHEEAGPKTMGYTLTILTLYEMALEAALETGVMPQEKYDCAVEALERMTEAMEGNVAASEAWYEQAEQRLQEAGFYLVVGMDEGKFVAQEGALKLQETTLRAAIGFEYEEFLHGPIGMFYSAPAGIYLQPAVTKPDSLRMETLAGIHAQYASAVFTIRRGDACATTNDTLMLQAPAEPWLAPFWQIVPLQVLSARLPVKLGSEGKLHEMFTRIDQAVSIKYKG